MNDSILTIVKVAQLLKVAEKTVYALAQRSGIPAFKVGGQWRFSNDALRAWIAERSRLFAKAQATGKVSQSREALRYSRRHR